MRFENFGETLEERAKKSGRSLDGQWLHENEVRENIYGDPQPKKSDFERLVELLGEKGEEQYDRKNTFVSDFPDPDVTKVNINYELMLEYLNDVMEKLNSKKLDSDEEIGYIEDRIEVEKIIKQYTKYIKDNHDAKMNFNSNEQAIIDFRITVINQLIEKLKKQHLITNEDNKTIETSEETVDSEISDENFHSPELDLVRAFNSELLEMRLQDEERRRKESSSMHFYGFEKAMQESAIKYFDAKIEELKNYNSNITPSPALQNTLKFSIKYSINDYYNNLSIYKHLMILPKPEDYKPMEYEINAKKMISRTEEIEKLIEQLKEKYDIKDEEEKKQEETKSPIIEEPTVEAGKEQENTLTEETEDEIAQSIINLFEQNTVDNAESIPTTNIEEIKKEQTTKEEIQKEKESEEEILKDIMSMLYGDTKTTRKKKEEPTEEIKEEKQETVNQTEKKEYEGKHTKKYVDKLELQEYKKELEELREKKKKTYTFEEILQEYEGKFGKYKDEDSYTVDEIIAEYDAKHR